MAIIDYDYTVDPIHGSRQGNTFTTSQGGATVKRRPSPINPGYTHRSSIRSIMSAAGKRYWAFPNWLKLHWTVWGENNGMTKPFPKGIYQLGNAAYLTVNVNAKIAGDSFYDGPPGNIPIPGVTFTNLVRIDTSTVRATFNPSPAGWGHRIYLRQAIPGPGVRRWDPANGYIAEYSARNPNSTHDFTTHFPHPAGWHSRYWLGTQDTKGRRALETLFDL